jgi:putative Mn2+ efflux pump MntP
MLKVAGAFGLFQMAMPLLGWLIGQTVVELISSFDHWLAFALLAFIAVRMAWEFIKGGSESESVDIGKWANLLTLAVATSIDALAVGLSFAFLHINIWIAAAIIGVVAFSVSAVSYWLGRKVNAWIGRWALLLGAVILIAIGFRILVTHWTA